MRILYSTDSITCRRVFIISRTKTKNSNHNSIDQFLLWTVKISWIFLSILWSLSFGTEELQFRAGSNTVKIACKKASKIQDQFVDSSDILFSEVECIILIQTGTVCWEQICIKNENKEITTKWKFWPYNEWIRGVCS